MVDVFIMDDDPDIENTPDGTIIKTAEKFLGLMRKSHSIWHEGSRKNANWVFRGQADSLWPLIPTIWRENNLYASLIEQLSQPINLDEKLGFSSNSSVASRRVSAWVYMELVLLKNFTRIAWKNAFAISAPNSMDFAFNLGFSDKPIIRNLEPLLKNKYSEEYNLLNPKNDPNICTAQHYGVPTRMLDWSDSALTACYFATNSIKKTQTNISPSHIAVWALCQSYLPGIPSFLENEKNSEEGHLIQSIYPNRSSNEFVRAQEGLLTCIENNWAIEYFLINNSWPSIEEVIKRYITEQLKIWRNTKLNETIPFIYNNPILRKFMLPYSEIDNLRVLIAREGISKEKLMPTLSHVAEASNQQILDFYKIVD